jgi:hypothetical protein
MQGRKTTKCEEAEKQPNVRKKKNDQMCGRTRCKEEKQEDVRKKTNSQM